MVTQPLNPERRDCETWKELNEAIESLSGAEPYRYVFRGHRNASWRLQPSIERICNGATVFRNEACFFNEFRAKAHLYAPDLPPHGDTLGWFSTMQHHDVPTRLLDWSYSAYVALYFAVSQRSDEPRSALWAINQAILTETSGDISKAVFGASLSEYLADPERLKLADAVFDSSTGLIAPVLPTFHVSRLSS